MRRGRAAEWENLADSSATWLSGPDDASPRPETGRFRGRFHAEAMSVRPASISPRGELFLDGSEELIDFFPGRTTSQTETDGPKSGVLGHSHRSQNR